MDELINLGYMLFFMGGRAMFFIAGGLVCGIIAAIIASCKGRSVFGWFLLGCLLNLIAILLVGFLPALTPAPRAAASPVARTELPEETSSENIAEFKNSLPEEFQNYVYIYKKSGVAFDLQNSRVYLKQDDLVRIYQKSAIREIQSKQELPISIVVRVADLDHPLWQLKFPNENEQARYREVFWQFQEGTLKPNAEWNPQPTNTAKPGFCPHCGADCREYPLAVACHACHQYFNEEHKPLEQ